MRRRDQTSLAGIGASVGVGALIALAGSQGSSELGGMPTFALCGLIAFLIQFIAFVPSYLAHTEHYYDITGTFTYLTLITVALLASDNLDARATLVAVLVVVWALRLGSFLFTRVRRDGGDGRFDKIKHHPLWFLMMWSIQGLWVFLTVACATSVITSTDREPFGVLGVVGLAVWIAGFAIEVAADSQKRAFRANAANEGAFINTGLWAWSRHPNYFGEIVLWVGIAIIALPVLSGWRWVMLISPIFVVFLLTRVSGVPMLEARADGRWGGDTQYEAYKQSTPVLVPRPSST